MALVALILLIVSGARLLSDLYTGLAVHKREQLSASPVGLEAARLATQLTPWNASAWSEYSYRAAQSGNTDLAVSAISEAIFWQPADAAKWSTLAQILLHSGRVDQQLIAATSYIPFLAPNAPNLQKRLALEGVYWWPYGNERLRQIWLDTIRAVLRQQKDVFLVAIISSHQEQPFCKHLGRPLALGKWCEWTGFMRPACAKKNLPQDQKAMCKLTGFSGDSQP